MSTAKQLSRKFRLRVLQIVFIEYWRLRRQAIQARRRGESVEPIHAQANLIGRELSEQYKLLASTRNDERMLKRTGSEWL